MYDEHDRFHDAVVSIENDHTEQWAGVQFYGEKTGWTSPNSWIEETQNGIRYVARFELPRYAAYGEWRMTHVALVDMVGNRVTYRYPGDWPAHFNTFRFTNGPATEPPAQDFVSPNPVYVPLIRNS